MTDRPNRRPPPVVGPVSKETLEKLSALSDGVEDLRSEVRSEVESNEKRVRASQEAKRRTHAVAVGGVIVGLLGLAVGSAALVAGTKAQDAVDLVVQQRTEARLTQCVEDNKGRAADRASILALATPEALARAEEDPARLQVAVNFLAALRPDRSCEAGDIAAYYESGGVEGLLPLDLPSHVSDFLDRHRAP